MLQTDFSATATVEGKQNQTQRPINSTNI